MAIAWIAIKREPPLMAAFRAVPWEIKEFSPARFQETNADHFRDVELVVLELSDGSLIDLCREICSRRIVPMLILVADLAHAQAGLEVGADDFVVLPVDPFEVLLRARKLVRAAGIVRVGDLQIDLAAWRVEFGGCRIHLSPVEFRLLACLAKRLGQIVGHAEIMQEVWGWETEYPALTQLKNCISRLRQKIEPDMHNPQYIITLSKHGYRLRNQRQWKARVPGIESIHLPSYEEHGVGAELDLPRGE
jgi:two-component system response regulator MtrA